MRCMSVPLPIFKKIWTILAMLLAPWTVFLIFSQLIGLTSMFTFQMGKPRSKEINSL